ncbi:MAG: helix-turn-helix transcriptional regulator [Clostridia bacterium]|nr:helix-turn-helix transcriptional regulator [Clostridia bacterium]
MGFGNRLRQLRKEKKLTQRQLAEMVGLRHSVVSFYEIGERSPSPEIIKKLASSLHVSSDYLLGIDRGETVDLFGLDEEDKHLVRTMVETLRSKKQKER